MLPPGSTAPPPSGPVGGAVEMWDFDDKKLLRVHHFPNLPVRSLKMDAHAKYIAVGFYCMLSLFPASYLASQLPVLFAPFFFPSCSAAFCVFLCCCFLSLLSSLLAGALKILAADTLAELQSFKQSTDAITHLCFSEDSLYLATADRDNCVGIYRFYHRDEDLKKPEEWIFLGKYRAHRQPITGMTVSAPFVSLSLFNGEVRLARSLFPGLFFGSDRRRLPAASPALDSALGGSGGSESVSSRAVPLLWSIGEDRMVHCFNVLGSSIREGLRSWVSFLVVSFLSCFFSTE